MYDTVGKHNVVVEGAKHFLQTYQLQARSVADNKTQEEVQKDKNLLGQLLTLACLATSFKKAFSEHSRGTIMSKFRI